jgi:hypothetical protein
MRHITGMIQQSVEIGEDAIIDGVIQGAVAIHSGTVLVRGTIQGSTDLGSGADLRISGALEGSVHNAPDAQLTVEVGGKLAGSLHNDGRVVIRGVFGGQRRGDGTFELEGDGWVKPPDEVRDGTYIYRW